MKEAQIFEAWVNQLSEGTWALPDTPESQEKLNQLMANELIVGPDATNATELLYDVVGDDELFDILNDLADRSQGRANCWDDSDVQRRLAELGIQTPQSTQAQPANVPQDTAPEVKENRDHSPVASAITRRIITQHPEVLAKYGPAVVSLEIDDVADFVGDVDEIGSSDVSGWVSQVIRNLGRFAPVPEKRMAEGDNTATFVEDRELAEMLKYAGVPIQENVLTDSTGSTLEHIKDTFRRDVKDFVQSGEMSDALYDALYDYYFDDMPYGTKKARDGDPYEWIGDRFAQDIGIEENLIAPVIEPVAECNCTMEGEYCPAHGLAECGTPAMGGAVGMPYSMGEAQAPQDPINSNSAMTGSYYEGKETDIQEGDALLARIKSLALLK